MRVCRSDCARVGPEGHSGLHLSQCVRRRANRNAIPVTGEDHVSVGTDGLISPTEVTPEFVAAFRKNTQERKARGIAAPYETEDGYLLRVFGETWG